MRGGVGEKGFIELIAAIIILAVTLAASPFLIQVTKHVSSEIAEANTPLNSYVSVSNGVVSAINPMPYAIKLDRITLTVNGQPVKIKDENGNGIWEPFERIYFDLSPMYSRDVVVVTLYIDGKEVYRTVYVKPSVVAQDRDYPIISIDRIGAKKALTMELKVSDDTAVAQERILVGNKIGEERTVRDFDVLERVAKEHGKSLKEVIKELDKFLKNRVERRCEILKDLQDFRNKVSINAKNLENATYIRIVAKDVTGKTSSKIIWLKALAPKVVILNPKDGDIFWSSEKIHILAKAIDAKSVYLYFDGKLILSKEAQSDPFEFGATIKPSVGEHTIKAVAVNAAGRAEDTVRFAVRKDRPPTVEITNPKNGSKFYTISSIRLNVTAVARDDRGVRDVKFYLNSVLKCIDNSAPYECSITVSPGNYTVKAVAVDTAGQTNSSSVNFEVIRPEPPIVSINAPSNVQAHRTVTIDIGITAHSPFGLKDVELIVNGRKIDEWTANSNSFSKTVPLRLGIGKNEIRALATDSFGQEGVAEKIVTVELLNKPPVISAPKTINTVVGRVVRFSVTAKDPDGDAVKLSASDLPSGAKFTDGTFIWTPTKAGKYAVKFTATDSYGASSSTTTTIIVTPSGFVKIVLLQDPNIAWVKPVRSGEEVVVGAG